MTFLTKAPLGNEDGVATVYHFDPDSLQTHISYHQEVGDILDRNHAFRSEGQRDDAIIGRKVAEIPVVVYMEWCRLAGVNVADFMRWKRKEKVAFCKRFLNDSDWYKLKSVEGKV